ncbi:MAG: response regulator [Planctomycetota bacterium]
MATILVVEDDASQRQIYSEELAADGYQVILAENGKDALARIQDSPIDLVIMDIRMPQMDGMETMGKVLGRRNDIPVILHTAYASYKDNFLSWAAEAYVVKRSDLTELKAKVRQALDRRAKSTISKGR